MTPAVHIARIFSLVAALAIGIVVDSAAQVIPEMPYSGLMEGYYQTWEVTQGGETETINQLVTPIGVFLPVTDKMDVRLATSYASFARDTEGGTSESVSGLTDVRIHANYAALDRRLLVGLVANVPSGSGELTSIEQDIVFGFVSPDLSVRANRLGEGFNIGGSLTFATPISTSAVFSIGGGVISRGGYDTSLPTSESPISLEPGLLANGSVGIDVFTGMNHLRLASTFSYFGTERVDDADYYRIGPELAILADYSLGYSQGKGRFSAGLHQIIRFDNSAVSRGAFGTEETSTNGSYLAVSASNAYAVHQIVSIDVSALTRLVGKNEHDAGDATVFEGGLGVSVIAAQGLVLGIGGRYVTGSGTGFDGLDREITGIEGAFRLTAQLPG